MRHSVFWGLILCFLTKVLWCAPVYVFQNSQQETRFYHLLTTLRCVVCQNQDLADSNASLAIDLRQQVFEKIQQGQSDEAIVDYLVARYGDFILFKPAFKTETMVLWMGPMVMLLMGFVIFWRISRGNHDAS